MAAPSLNVSIYQKSWLTEIYLLAVYRNCIVDKEIECCLLRQSIPDPTPIIIRPDSVFLFFQDFRI